MTSSTNISALFIRRPVATALLTAALALAGIVAYQLLPAAPLPQVDYPTIQVSAALPGASPETMASSVATPLERQFGRIAGIAEMSSTSVLGATSLTLQFDLNRNIDAAARDIQAAINAARGQLPTNLPATPSWRKINPTEQPIIILSLATKAVPAGKVYDVASSIVMQRLSQLRGVGQVGVGGSALPGVRVDVNPTLLNHYGLSLEDVRAMLGASNANRPKGDFSGETQTSSIRTDDQLLQASEYMPLVVAYRNGAPVVLSDVATVSDSVEDLRNSGYADLDPSILMFIFRQPGANIIETVDRIEAELPRLQAQIPAAIHINILQDRTGPIRASIAATQQTMEIAMLLVILVVFAFLRSWRTTLVPAITVPVSLVATFGALYLFGYTIDNLSLMALTIATGFLVDDAIVMIENITRHIEMGESPMTAALRGAKEIGPTVISISLSLNAVFIPILLMGGIVGRIFREFAVTLSMAIVFSLAITLATTPMMCSRLLRSQRGVRHSYFYNLIENFLSGMRGFYERSLTWVLRRQPLMLVVIIITMAVTVYLYIVIPKGFFPQQDTGRLNFTILADQSTSFSALDTRVRRVVRILMGDPAVAGLMAFMGSGGGGGGNVLNTSRGFLSLKPFDERKATPDQVIARLRPKLVAVPGTTVVLQAQQDLRVGGRNGAAQYQFTLIGDDFNELNRWGPRVLQKLKSLPQLADVSSDQQDRGLAASLVVDRATAARLGISTQNIDDTLYDAFGQRQVSTMYTQLNQYHVVMEVEPRFWNNPDGLKYIYVASNTGQQVPLSAFTRYTASSTPLQVNHSGQFPSVTISFNLPLGVSLGDAVPAVDEAMREINLPGSIRATFQGTAQAFQESLKNEPLLILAALIAVYIVLGVLYESLIHPLTILSTLPSAGVGALLALIVTGNELNVVSLIGIILLIGVVKKNAIMMIDFAIAAARQGKTSEEAIFEACLLRFRPIMMTTMAALFGNMPLAVSLGTGSELRRPLGIAIVGGLIFSQALTLYTTPVVYLYMDRMRLRWESFRARTRKPKHVPQLTSA
jgi:multidrug efflux pump